MFGEGRRQNRRPRRYLPDQTLSSCSATWLKRPSRLDPTAQIAEMMKTPMPAAISPYSMAVAPDSSCRKRKSLVMFAQLLSRSHLGQCAITEIGEGCPN